MKKYLAILPIGAAVVFAALLIPSDSFGYVRDGGKYELPPTCGAKVLAAIQSVYPMINPSGARRWVCNRTWQDEANPNGAMCGGVYEFNLAAGVWAERVYADGFAAWEPIARNGNLVTVRKVVDFVLLSVAQLQVHAPLFVDGCVLDDNGQPLTWPNIRGFEVFREGETVQVHVMYITAEPSAEDLADARIAQKALLPIGQAP